MDTDTRPYLGLSQPRTGPIVSVASLEMARRSKKDKPEPAIRAFIAENVRILRDRTYAALPTETARNKKLAKDADCSLSQVQRAIAGRSGISVDFLEWFAKAFGVRPQDLATPYFAQAHISPAPQLRQPSQGDGDKSNPRRKAG